MKKNFLRIVFTLIPTLTLLTTSLITSTSALAAHTKSTNTNPHKPLSKTAYDQVIQSAAYNDSWKSNFPMSSKTTNEASAKLMKDQESKRKLASDMDQEFFENKMSPELKKFRQDFLKTKTADDLDALILQLDKNYETYPPDLKFIAAQLIPLRALRGIIWRLVPTIEDTRIAHSVVLTTVKNLAVNINLLLPTEQWQAGFDYVSQPFIENGEFPFSNTGKVVLPFERNNESAVQAYLRSAAIPLLRTSAARLEKLDLSSEVSVWDNKLLYGSGSFPSALSRYSLFGEVERHAALTNIYGTLSEMCFQSAYSMQGFLSLNQDIGRLYGWDGSFLSKVNGVTAAKKIQVIRKPQYSNYGLLFQDGPKWTNDAWFFLTRSVEHGSQTWQAMKNRSVSENYMLSNAYQLAFQRPINNSFENLHRLVDGPTEIRSYVTDEKVTVNIKDFYLNPPQDLKQLYATGFDESKEMIKIDFKVNSQIQSASYRNYLYGSSTQWNLSIYKKYFPEVKTNEDLKKTARVLSQSWGTFMVAAPLVNYMN